MYQIRITEKEAGQRLDKYLHRILPKAESGFIYKMLRKKNITLNDKKAGGGEKIAVGDSITIYFSDETLEKFMGRKLRAGLERTVHGTGSPGSNVRNGGNSAYRVQNHIDSLHGINVEEDQAVKAADYMTAYDKMQNIRILYENDHVLLADKPVGILSQKAENTDISLNEWLVGYLLQSGAVTEDELAVFKPSVCNRLDRNTSGIVLCSKTLKGAQLLSELLKRRTLRKYYRLYVKGIVDEKQMIEGYLIKDEKLNKVFIEPVNDRDYAYFKNLHDDAQANRRGAYSERKEMRSLEQIRSSYIKTGYRPVKTEQDKTLLEVELFTGKTHQIRAHLASIGHPLLGDYKYGDKAWNDRYKKKFQVRSQLLHAYKVVFPQLDDPFGDLSGRMFVAELPEIFEKVSDEM